MKKKIFSAALLFAVSLAATSTFVSCSDYDDEISDLQKQIDDLAEADQLYAKITDMQSAISTAKTELSNEISAIDKVADAAKDSAEKAQKAVDELKQNGATKSEVKAAQDAADAAKDSAEKAQKALNDYKEANDKAVKAAQSAANAAQTTADSCATVLAGITGDKGTIAKAQQAADDAKQAAKDALTAAEKADSVAKAATTAIDAIKGAKYTEGTTLASLSADIAAIKSQLGIGEATGEGVDLKELSTRVNNINQQLVKIIGEYSTMVTSVSLYYSSTFAEGVAQNGVVKFERITEYENVFPETALNGKQYTFTKDKVVTYESDPILVRVSPTTADLSASMIHLINSQGAELDDLVTCSKVERYDALLTRAASNNGLWKVSFQLKEGYDPDDFEAAVKDLTKKDKSTNSILFAVAIDNTSLNDDDRRVISAYDLTVTAEEGVEANDDIFAMNMEGDWKSINDVKNRATEKEVDGEKVKEYEWADNIKQEKKVKPIYKGTDVNTKEGDDRHDKNVYITATVDEPIALKVSYEYDEDATDEQKKWTKNKIKGFYVTLDTEFADTEGSAPSELNAWNSYEYKGLNTLIDGNDGTITISNKNNVVNDIIGFRVYAVALDGTIIDPDGRAFYVKVGNPAEVGTLTASITATSKSVSSEIMEMPFELSEKAELTNGKIEAWTISEDDQKYYGKNEAGKDELTETSPVFDVTFYKDAEGKELATKASEAKYYKFSSAEISKYIDGESYTQTLKIMNGDLLAQTITATMTKVMPEAKEVKYLSGQTEYQVFAKDLTKTGYPAYALPVADEGSIHLENVLYEKNDETGQYEKLNSKGFTLKFANSADDEETENVVDYTQPLEVTKGADGHFTLTVAKDLIDNTTSHAISVEYAYESVSTKLNTKTGKWETAQNYDVDCAPLKMTYCCWNYYSSDFAWKSDFTKNKGNKLQWKSNPDATGTTMALSNAESKNTYNKELFSKDLATLIKNNTLAVKDGTLAYYTSANEVNPYFEVSFAKTDDVITGLKFVQKEQQTLQAPQSEVAGVVKFTVYDVFNHEIVVSLSVSVLPQK